MGGEGDGCGEALFAEAVVLVEGLGVGSCVAVFWGFQGVLVVVSL